MFGQPHRKAAETVWQVPRPDPAAANALAEALRVSPLIAQILLNRGVSGEEEARSFLEPSLEDLADPTEVPGIARAVPRLLEAVKTGEEIVVFGDYDVDGISGTALLTGFLELLGGRVRPRLPNRLEEGYGLSEAAVREFFEEGVSLLVTVDHGTTALAEIDAANALGIDVVVVDHHTPGESLPAAAVLVNPHLGAASGALPCGTGVAFKLAWALATALAGGPRVAQVHRDYLADALGLVALGTVADVVPLTGENRIFSRFGLEILARSSRPGLRALIQKSRLNGETPTAGDVGFRLAPRLNAAGRLGTADLALELLTTGSEARAEEIALLLDRENVRRREIEAEIFDRALRRVERDYAPDHAGALVVGEEGWHAGVVGIVAARLVDRFYRPAAVVAFSEGLGRGSCRSIPGIPLPAALERCGAHLVSYGGHAAAAGFTVRIDRFEEFRAAFDAAVREIAGPETFRRRIRLDAIAPLASMTEGLVRAIERLAPFGAGNARPVFGTREVRIAGRARRVGSKGEHLSFRAADGRRSFKTIGFRMGPLADLLPATKAIVDIAFTPRFDEWKADGSIELEILDLSIHDG